MELRKQSGTVEYRIFTALKQMIAVRKEMSSFADFNNRELFDVGNPHLFVFSRFNLTTSEHILVVSNFDASPQYLNLDDLSHRAFNQLSPMIDVISGGVQLYMHFHGFCVNVFATVDFSLKCG